MSHPTDKGFNPEKLTYLPSLFKNYDYNSITVRDLSGGQVSSLSVLGDRDNLYKLMEIYRPCFITVTDTQYQSLLYIDFITALHYINHISFGIYDSSFSYKCECGKTHRVSYTLYDIDFNKPKSSYKDNIISVDSSVTLSIKPFTVLDMAKINLEGLSEENDAFLVSSLNLIKIGDKVDAKPEDIKEAIEWLNTYPSRIKEAIKEAVNDRYVTTKPIEHTPECGKSFKYTPDLTLKGLPYFT